MRIVAVLLVKFVAVCAYRLVAVNQLGANCATKISTFVNEWTSINVPVIVFASIDDYRHGPHGPWTEFQASIGEMTTFADKAAPFAMPHCLADNCTPLSMRELMPLVPAYFFHGGNIKFEWFKRGVDFRVAQDTLAGPTFYVTHNPFLAAAYGFKGVGQLHGRTECRGGCDCNNYRQVLQLTIRFPEKCRGLVPSWGLLEKLSKLPVAEKKALLEVHCGEHCDFLAINWNKDGGFGQGMLPYEFRLLPGSIARCGLAVHAVLLVPFDLEAKDPMFGEPFFSFGSMREAGRIQEQLLSLAEKAGVGVDKTVAGDFETWSEA